MSQFELFHEKHGEPVVVNLELVTSAKPFLHGGTKLHFGENEEGGLLIVDDEFSEVVLTLTGKTVTA